MSARERVARRQQLRAGHAAGIALARKMLSTDPPVCVCHRSSTAHRSQTVAIALDLCAHIRRELVELAGGAS